MKKGRTTIVRRRLSPSMVVVPRLLHEEEGEPLTEERKGCDHCTMAVVSQRPRNNSASFVGEEACCRFWLLSCLPARKRRVASPG
ncbi:hypothetical protein SESBI_38029 [Sesbania bispinosa]|nr:hypothetical protein SESBI_38029 [Sesbania bispinosa]